MGIDTAIVFLCGAAAGVASSAIAGRKGAVRMSLPHPMQRARRGLKTITSHKPHTSRKVRTEQDERRFPPRPRKTLPWPDALALARNTLSAEPDNRPRLTPPTSRQAMLLAQANLDAISEANAVALENIAETVRAQLGEVAEDGTWLGRAFKERTNPDPPPESPA